MASANDHIRNLIEVTDTLSRKGLMRKQAAETFLKNHADLADNVLLELERADRVIGVLMAHIGYLSEYDKRGLERDLAARGFSDHTETRRAILIKAFALQNEP
jgi:hypothetical protein